MDRKSVQSLPRELRLAEDNTLRLRPLRELESLRYDPVVLENIAVTKIAPHVLASAAPASQTIAELPGDSVEIRITVERQQALRKLFGFVLFADDNGGGLPILFRPETGALRVGTTEAPFAVNDLPENESVEVRIFIDRHLVEVFVNDRQALLATYPDYVGKQTLSAFTIGAPTTLQKVEIWKLHPANQGFFEAQASKIWEPNTQ